MAIDRKVAVIGLGYVGLPVAVAFGQKNKVIGFDINAARIAELNKDIDSTNEVSQHALKQADVQFTTDADDLAEVDFFIVAVPTPIDEANQPNLAPLFQATQTIAKQLKLNDIVVYESTVFPGATEEECVPILESGSGLTFNRDFYIGYSPERINPGDTKHSFANIAKVVAGSNQQVLEIIAQMYGQVVNAGVHKAQNIKVAEAAKVLENTQRDLNIALMNELALICQRMKIDTQAVIDMAATKWNFIPFRPGLVGGHCIGVDPYYLTYKAKQLGFRPEVILAGRRINDNMGKYIAEQTVKLMIHAGCNIKNSRVGVLGLTFKENCSDTRNSKVVGLITELVSYGIQVLTHDPFAAHDQAKKYYDIDLVEFSDVTQVDALVLAVGHDEYKSLPINEITEKLNSSKILVDIKGILNKNEINEHITLWRL